MRVQTREAGANVAEDGIFAIGESLVQSIGAVFHWVTASVSDLDATDWVAFGAMLAAFVAAWEAVRSRRLSSRMYDITVREQLRRETPLEVYLVDAQIFHVLCEQRRVYVFELVITNKSVAANSIKQLSLSLGYAQDNRPPSNLAIEHDPNALDKAVPQVGSVLYVPRGVASGEAVSGTAVFPVADRILEGEPIEMYTVQLLDTYDRAAECQAMLLRETEL